MPMHAFSLDAQRACGSSATADPFLQACWPCYWKQCSLTSRAPGSAGAGKELNGVVGAPASAVRPWALHAWDNAVCQQELNICEASLLAVMS